MRRALAIFLALAFGLGPCAALLQADEDTRLPFCCRRHGAHHCAMNDVAAEQSIRGNSGSALFFAAPSHCPLYPAGPLAPSSSNQAIASVRADSLATTSLGYVLIAASSAFTGEQISYPSVRGPPASFFS
jgi:hypothetical protein